MCLPEMEEELLMFNLSWLLQVIPIAKAHVSPRRSAAFLPCLGPKNLTGAQISEPNVQTFRIHNAFFKILSLPSGTAREWVENG